MFLRSLAKDSSFDRRLNMPSGWGSAPQAGCAGFQHPVRGHPCATPLSYRVERLSMSGE
jgi:hypothetical protein